MKAYWIALYKKIHNTKNLKDYETVQGSPAFGGRPLVRGGEYECLEGENFSRTVIWEFPSYKKAFECHNSKEYQDGWVLAKDTTERNLQIIQGFSTE